MSEYSITSVLPNDRYLRERVDNLLIKEGIRRDANLDYTAAMLDDDYQVIATGSCFGNTLRCMAVDSSHQGEALMNDIVSHLIEYQYARGNYHLFLYTKCNSAKFFGSLGFTEIARVEGQIVFMENKRTGFETYLKGLQKETETQLAALPHSGEMSSAPRISALVMNANPFTLGHQYLVETAAKASDLLHLFIVSEEQSLVPFEVRKRLVQEGTAQFDNIIYHDSGSYIISSATFPAYFQKDDAAVIESQARLDLAVFSRIAESLGIQTRYVGSEPTSVVTSAYNAIMAEELPKQGIACHIIERKEADGKPISASTVRKALQEDNLDLVKSLVPESTYRFFTSAEAAPVIAAIKNTGNVIHY